jgi:trans-aconitate 2-methyltransferase
MISFATSHFDGVAHPNLRFEVADARDLRFNDEFDLVISFNALHWIPEQGRALQSIRRAMKTIGTARLRLVPKGNRKSLEDVLEETRLSPRWSRYYGDFRVPYLHMTPEEYASAAERNGLRVQRIHSASKAWDFKTRDAFFAFGSVTFVEWTRRLPEPQRPAFINDALDRYRIVACDGPGEENTFKFYQMDVMLAPA